MCIGLSIDHVEIIEHMAIWDEKEFGNVLIRDIRVGSPIKYLMLLHVCLGRCYVASDFCYANLLVLMDLCVDFPTDTSRLTMSIIVGNDPLLQSE